jgi:hypothetical protein
MEGGFMAIKGLKAFTVLSEPTAGADDPASYDTIDEVAGWFRKAMDNGYTFVALPEDEAQMLKNGIPQRKVWVEDQSEKKLSLALWLRR